MNNCRHCGVSLDDSNWPKHRQRDIKPDRVCVTCYNDKARIYNREYQRDYRHQNIARNLYSAAKARARKKNLEFDLELSDIIIPQQCPVFGVPLERAEGGFPLDNSPTLDRIDSSKGYVKGNVNVISWKANRLKSNGTLRDFENLVAWLRSVQ